MEIITPTNLRKDIYKVTKDILENETPIEITIAVKEGTNDGIVMVPKKQWTALQEELYLQKTGTLDYVSNLMENSTDDDFEEA